MMKELFAPEGYEYYNLENPDVAGTRISLSELDGEENWALREIVEEEELKSE